MTDSQVYFTQVDALRAANAALESEIARQQAALRFYASASNYESTILRYNGPIIGGVDEERAMRETFISADRGARARAALAPVPTDPKV